jgi:hypothetical protein
MYRVEVCLYPHDVEQRSSVGVISSQGYRRLDLSATGLQVLEFSDVCLPRCLSRQDISTLAYGCGELIADAIEPRHQFIQHIRIVCRLRDRCRKAGPLTLKVGLVPIQCRQVSGGRIIPSHLFYVGADACRVRQHVGNVGPCRPVENFDRDDTATSADTRVLAVLPTPIDRVVRVSTNR